MRTVTQTSSLVLAATLLSATAWAQTGQITGQLRGSDGSAAAGVVVTFDRQDAGGDESYTVTTDASGAFMQPDVAAGDYQVSFQVGDTAYTTLARIGEGATEMSLDLGSLEYQAGEMSQEEGAEEATVTRVVRDIRSMDAGISIIAPPRNEEERAAREAAATSGDVVRAAFDAGLVALDAGDNAEAINQFSIAASGDSTQHVIFGNLGLAYERSEMWPQAAAAYGEAQTQLDFMEEPPAGVNYFASLTLANAMLGNVDKALEYAEKGAVVDPAGAGQSFYNVGAVLTNQGDTEGALQAFQRAIEVNPDMAEAYYQLALARFGNEATIPDAIPLLERYLELAPDGPNAAGAQGLLQFARGGQ